MLTTLKATVVGNEIQWLEASEKAFPPNRSVPALITPLEEPPGNGSVQDRAQRRITALKKLASINAFSGISDPQAWQRETREDRELPGRE